LRETGFSRGIFAFRAHIGTQLAFEHITLVRFGLALDAISQVERLLFPRHLPFNLIKAGYFLADGRVLNSLPNKKLERHRVPFLLGRSYQPAAATVIRAMTTTVVAILCLPII
jgi:hypothetical protein